MKLAWILVPLATIACGSAPGSEDGADSVTTEQPIYLLQGYGSEQGSSNGARCIPPWGGAECRVPDQRNFAYRVVDCGSAGSFVYDGVVSSITSTSAEVSRFGWSITHSTGTQPAQWTIRCTGDDDAAPGNTSYDSWMDCHDTQYGELCQFQGGTISIRLGTIFQLPAFQQATNEVRKRVIFNITKHEIGHTLGFGHTFNDLSKLMNNAFPAQNQAGISDGWDGYLNFTNEERNFLDCYNPNSTTHSYC